MPIQKKTTNKSAENADSLATFSAFMPLFLQKGQNPLICMKNGMKIIREDMSGG